MKENPILALAPVDMRSSSSVAPRTIAHIQHSNGKYDICSVVRCKMWSIQLPGPVIRVYTPKNVYKIPYIHIIYTYIREFAIMSYSGESKMCVSSSTGLSTLCMGTRVQFSCATAKKVPALERERPWRRKREREKVEAKR